MAARAPFPFRYKLTLSMALLSIVPAAGVGLGLLDVNARTLTTESRKLQIAVADDVSRAVEEETDKAEAALELVARVLANGGLSESARVAVPSALVERDAAVDVVGVYGADGALIDVVRGASASAVEMPDPLPPAARRALEAGTSAGPFLGDVDASAGEPRLFLAASIRVNGTITGHVATLARLAPIQARVERLNEAFLASTSGTLYLVDEDKRLLAHPDAERAHARADMSDREILRGVDPRTLHGRAARTVEVERDDGAPILGTVVGLGSRPWAVVVEVPRDVAYASLGEMRTIVIAIVALAAIVALLVAFVTARFITAPIEKLSAFARDLAARRFDRRVEVDTKDELASLAHAMSQAAAELEASEERIQKEAQIRADLGRYLPAELVENIVAREQDMGLGGVRREISVLFADVVAFTPLTEKLPPEETVALLNELFTVLTELVFRHGGTVDKFVGDCVMALFGAPAREGDHARRAVECAEDMIRWLETANVGWRERYGATVQLAIGIHSGEAVVGNIGSKKRMDYTAIGDVVNVAARLEAIARPQQILISRATRDAAGDAFEYGVVGERVLSGRAEPVELFEVRA
jgi:class 3 adenylate cyclase